MIVYQMHPVCGSIIDGEGLIKFTRSIRGLGIQHKSRVVISYRRWFFLKYKIETLGFYI